MKLVAVVLAFIGSSTFASNNGYDLKMDLSMNGKYVFSPSITVKAGEMKSIRQKTDTQESFIEVVATEGQVKNNKGIMMNFTVGYIGKNGERKVISKPQILAKENEPALITVGEKDGTELSLSVVAKRKSL